MKKTAAIIFRSLILILCGIAIGIMITDSNLTGRSFGSMNEEDKVSRIMQLIREKYVDTVNLNRIQGEAINNVLQNLDPHSVYLPPQQAQSINERLDGGFDGIGIEYQLLRDTVFVTQVYPGGPAAKAGILAGDRVLTVEGKPLSGSKLSANKIDRLFRGERNTTLHVVLAGMHNGKTRNCTLTRDHVDLSSLDAGYMLSDDIGYIKLSKFAATTDNDFRTSLKKLQTHGLQKLILDLRGNGGGYLNAATAMAGEFVPKGKLIVYTQGAHEPRTDYFATDTGLFRQGNLAVLIDEYSASASEILAGCLQDLDRATLVGRRSFGKGLVQEQFPFDDGSAINLTVARYYTPSGRSIQKSYKKGIDSYHNEIADRLRKGELYSAQSSMSDSAFRTASVYHTTKGKKVYSGGGIMPDIFIPADTIVNTVLVQELSDQQLFTAYVIDHLYPIFKKYPTEDDFIAGFNISDDQLHQFILYASNTIKEMDSHELLISKPSIKTLLKAFAGRFQWGDNAYYRTVNGDDVCIKKGMNAVK
ncbi:carboxyl-terminal processing protease [Mucilaginibacter yixingensis]|uniref:Carboxyl-terminal processing protease n=1 Tax=Mucilaginibacter yixingensis TaxID=1295612 RepID=A0A2T5JCU7_9SPHI|nr:S41 family peptidase [Mucilaginibacter yixingensis]PTQ99583.1 carboxyl-terminal processing protease [Mucilaginibacter yixingensis]